MKRTIAFILVLLLVLPMLFACGDKADQATAADIPQRIICANGGEAYGRIYSLYVSSLSDEEKAAEAAELAAMLKGWQYEGEKIGGAEYEGKIYTQEEATFVADSDDSFMAAIKQAKSGDIIFVPTGAVIELSDLYYTESFIPTVKEGVVIASDRGRNAGGVLRFAHQAGTVLVCEDGATVTGINISGVNNLADVQAEKSASDCGIRIKGEGINISNCEIACFSKSGITVFPGGKATVEQCFIHHCTLGANDDKAGLTLKGNAFFANGENYKNGDEVTIPEGNTQLEKRENAAPKAEQVHTDITSAVFPADMYEAYILLNAAAKGDTAKITDALSVVSGTDKYYYYKDKLSLTQDGKQYGYRPEKSPIGGGKGYESIITEGDYNVSDSGELFSALKNAKSGEIVFIKSDAKINVSGVPLAVPEGVTLASDRGYVREDGTVSTGGLIYTATRQEVAIELKDNALLTGVTLLGADTERHMNHLIRGYDSAANSYTDYYYKLRLSRGVVIKGENVRVTNCEISGFSEAGVLVEKSTGFEVAYNYIHHNQRNGYGYGVCLSGESVGEIYQNLFNFDRHAIAADGRPGSGYSAHDNIHMGTAIYHIFDAHGGADRGDGTDIACDKVEMFNNTFLSEQLPYKKRGTPAISSTFTRNIVIYPESYYTNRMFYGNNFVCEDNIFGIAQPEKIEYDFENGKTFTINTSLVTKYENMEYLDAKTHSLRYANILVFTPAEEGYYISEYGNNLDDGSIRNWVEKVYIPEGGFVLVFTNDGEPAANRLYNAISARHGMIYNTTLTLHGDYKAETEGNKIIVTQSN